MVWGPQEIIVKESKDFTSTFDCDEVGEVKEYVRCKIDHNKNTREIKITQPVLLKSYQYQYDIENNKTNTPEEAGKV